MATMENMGRPRAVVVALLAATALSTVCADLARTSPASVLDWESNSQMQLSMTSENSPVPVSYTVIPLADDLGLTANRGVSAESHCHASRTRCDLFQKLLTSIGDRK